MSRAPAELVGRFRRSLEASDAPAAGSTVVVGVSGGMDSCVLLHLLRFASGGRLTPIVAYFDHAMRAGSEADGAWVRGLCRAWDLPFRSARARTAPASEAEARTARYAFLHEVREGEGAEAILTAHHADDQAETVLFRLLRGTGPSGLAGIPRARDGAVFRPLLELWRRDLADYAARVGLGWREDPSNAELGFARNVIRTVLLPEAERSVAPGARGALVRLAEVVAAEESAWDELLTPVIEALELRDDEGAVSFDRQTFGALHPAVAARVLRRLSSRWSVVPDHRGTRSAVEYRSAGRSGGGVELGGGVTLRRELDRLVLERVGEPAVDRPLTIPDEGPGRGEACLGGARIEVAWCPSGEAGPFGSEHIEVSAARLPIVVRGRCPGDRVRLASGSKKLKKLLLEARIPSDRRGRIPVIVDRAGEVLWIPGVARAVLSDSDDGPTVTIGVS